MVAFSSLEWKLFLIALDFSRFVNATYNMHFHKAVIARGHFETLQISWSNTTKGNLEAEGMLIRQLLLFIIQAVLDVIHMKRQSHP